MKEKTLFAFSYFRDNITLTSSLSIKQLKHFVCVPSIPFYALLHTILVPNKKQSNTLSEFALGYISEHV